MELLSRGIQDLRTAIERKDAAAPRRGRGSIAGRGAGGGRGLSSKSAASLQAPFAEAWASYQAVNPRLRDPRLLPALVRRGVPDELRAEVWAHCLGVVSSGALPAAAAPPAAPELAPEQTEMAPEQTVAEKAMLDPEMAVAGEEEVEKAAGALPEVACEAAPEATPEGAVEAIAREPALPHGIGELIEADVARTFPTSAEFQSVGGAEKLRKVLRCLALRDAELGYCQSLNFVAAVFIMVFKEEAAALAAVQQLLTKLGTRSWYTEGMKQLRADTSVLEDLMKERLPAQHAVLKEHRFDLLFVCSKWLLCLFATSLNGETLRRVWDAVLCDGIEAVFRVAFAMLARHSADILKARSMDDLIHMFQEAQPEPEPEELLRAAYDPELIGPLSRSELSQRRQQAVKRVSKGDTRLEMRQTALRRGGVRPASVLAR